MCIRDRRAYDRAKKATPPEARGSVKVSISCALFVPKAQTPFQWDGQITTEEAHRRINLLRSSVKYRAVDVHWHEPDVSLVEAMMSRGGREVCDVVETAWRHGARFDAWTEFFSLDTWRAACAECGVDMEGIAQGQYETSWVTPWDHLSVGVTTRFFRRERRLAPVSYTHLKKIGIATTIPRSRRTREPIIERGKAGKCLECRRGRILARNTAIHERRV